MIENDRYYRLQISFDIIKLDINIGHNKAAM